MVAGRLGKTTGPSSARAAERTNALQNTLQAARAPVVRGDAHRKHERALLAGATRNADAAVVTRRLDAARLVEVSAVFVARHPTGVAERSRVFADTLAAEGNHLAVLLGRVAGRRLEGGARGGLGCGTGRGLRLAGVAPVGGNTAHARGELGGAGGLCLRHLKSLFSRLERAGFSPHSTVRRTEPQDNSIFLHSLQTKKARPSHESDSTGPETRTKSGLTRVQDSREDGCHREGGRYREGGGDQGDDHAHHGECRGEPTVLHDGNGALVAETANHLVVIGGGVGGTGD